MFVYLGANAHKALVHQLLKINPKIRFVASQIYPEVPRSLLEDKLFNELFISFDSNLLIGSDKIRFSPFNDYNILKIIDTVMSDKHLPLLWTRFNSKTRWSNQSEVKRYEITYSLIKSAIEVCLTRKPSIVVFSYEPHMLPIYIFKKVCVALGVRTCTMTISPFYWRLFLEFTGNKHVECIENPLIKEEDMILNESVKRFIDEKKSEYSIAKPFYEKRVMSSGLGKRLYYKFKANGWKPHRVIQCQLAYSNYQRLSTERNRLYGIRYICVFLQLQPEQTTLPDGGLFVHHLILIQMLYSAVSTMGASLVIREHPATFESAFNSKWRPSDFYSSIKNIGPNIHFDDINAEPFTLIKNAIAVATITGTVLLESLLQGKPVIAFGKHPLRGFSSTALVDSFADEVELRKKIVKAIVRSPQSIIDDVGNYLYKVYPATFGADHYLGNEEMSLENLRDSRYNALLQVIDLLSQNSAVQDPVI